MEQSIIKEVLESYGLTPDRKTVKAVHQMMLLGFDFKWLRNMCIIRQFDALYKTDKPVMEIYSELSMDNQDLSVNLIRKIIRDRQLYEI